MLTLDQVWAAYDPNVPVLKGVSLALSGQETVAVLGANGAGKSTLLRLLSGLLPCLDGRIQFDGVDITRTPFRNVSKWAEVAGARCIVLEEEGVDIHSLKHHVSHVIIPAGP
jgi:ABC-type branched-subunit amino acid transport system ATPase component